MLKRAIVPSHAVVRALPVNASDKDALDLSYVEPNVLLELAAPVEVHGVFGRPRSATKLLLSVDDRDAFLAD